MQSHSTKGKANQWCALVSNYADHGERAKDATPSHSYLLPTDFPRDMRGLFLTPVEQADADDLVLDLKCFEKVNEALQGQGKTKETPRLSVAQARKVMDRLIQRFP